MIGSHGFRMGMNMEKVFIRRWTQGQGRGYLLPAAPELPDTGYRDISSDFMMQSGINEAYSEIRREACASIPKAWKAGCSEHAEDDGALSGRSNYFLQTRRPVLTRPLCSDWPIRDLWTSRATFDPHAFLF